jgi:hypothetical protein
MIFFPDLPDPSYPCEEELQENVLRSETENGYVVTRVKFTRQRQKFPRVHWRTMVKEDWLELLDFYKNTTASGSLMFSWIHPLTEVIYTVRFTEPPKATLVEANYYQVSISLEEV